MSDMDFDDRMESGADVDRDYRSATPAGVAKMEGASFAVKQKIDAVSEQARDAVSRITERAATAYETAAERAQQVGDRVQPMVRERPYAALAIAMAAGAVLGLLFAGRGPKVIYVKPRA